MESRSIWLVLLGVTIASFANGQNGKQSQSVILPSAARPGVSAALGHDIQRYGVRDRDGVLSSQAVLRNGIPNAWPGLRAQFQLLVEVLHQHDGGLCQLGLSKHK
jgi:hypothetical protein